MQAGEVNTTVCKILVILIFKCEIYVIYTRQPFADAGFKTIIHMAQQIKIKSEFEFQLGV